MYTAAIDLMICECKRVCDCACARARACVCVCVCVYQKKMNSGHSLTRWARNSSSAVEVLSQIQTPYIKKNPAAANEFLARHVVGYWLGVVFIGPEQRLIALYDLQQIYERDIYEKLWYQRMAAYRENTILDKEQIPVVHHTIIS